MDITILQELLVDSVEQSRSEIHIDNRKLGQVEALAYVVNANNVASETSRLTGEQLTALVELIGGTNQLTGKNALAASYMLNSDLATLSIACMAKSGVSECNDDMLKAMVNVISHANTESAELLLMALKEHGKDNCLYDLDFTEAFKTAIETTRPELFYKSKKTPEQSLVKLMKKLSWNSFTLATIAQEHNLDAINHIATKRIAHDVKTTVVSSNAGDHEYAGTINTRQSL